MYQKIVANLSSSLKRYETLDGQQYLVVPTVALTVGVHAGNQGPLFYPAEELAKDPVVWNHKPIVVNHPTMNGLGISACDPSVVETNRVGLIFNAVYDGRLCWESWLIEDKLTKVAPGVMQAINNNQMVEVSTGLFHDPEPKPGVWNGESYTAVVRNIRPDHLAILPDTKGACSIADGAGLLRNADASELSYDDVRAHIRPLIKDKHKTMSSSGEMYEPYAYISDIYPKSVVYEAGDKLYRIGYKVKEGKAVLTGEPEEVKRVTSYVTANGVVFNATDLGERKNLLRSALAGRFNADQKEQWTGTVVELDSTHVIWNQGNQLFRLPYVHDSGIIRVDGQPEEVELIRDFRPKGTTMVTANTIHKGTDQIVQDATKHLGDNAGDPNRKMQIDKLLGSGAAWTEADRPWLTNLPQDSFNRIATVTTPPAIPTPAPPVAQPVGNLAMTEEQYIKTLPPNLQSVIQNALNMERQQKEQLVGIITANKANVFTPEFLRLKSVAELQGIASLMGGQQPTTGVINYGGQAEVPMFISPSPTQNAQNGGQGGVPVLNMPAMTWDK